MVVFPDKCVINNNNAHCDIRRSTYDEKQDSNRL